MIEDIKMLKDKILAYTDQEVGKYGSSRMDVKQVGELADIIKDLAEAEYYCSVAEAMKSGNESAGYTQMGNERMGYGGQGGSRMGYGGSMGHTDPTQDIREMLTNADPETRAKIRSMVMGM